MSVSRTRVGRPVVTPAVEPRREPAALVEEAERAGEDAAAQARRDVALIRERMAQMKSHFYEIGLALARLKRRPAHVALGYSSFGALCTRELGFSRAKADELVMIATNVSAELARGLGQKNALALVALCRATPEDDSPEELVRTTVRLPSGETLEVAKASAAKKLNAAKALRDAAMDSGPSGRKGRGRRTTVEERRVAREIEARLRAAGLERARVEAVATRQGQGADVRLEGVPLAAVRELGAELRSKKWR
jgi:hypothetical protein